MHKLYVMRRLQSKKEEGKFSLYILSYMLHFNLVNFDSHIKSKNISYLS